MKNNPLLSVSIIFGLLAFLSNCYAQDLDGTKKMLKEFYGVKDTYTSSADNEILEQEAFDRMINQHITYAITGERVPTSGVKVDLTKATGTLSGFIPAGNLIKGVLLNAGIGATEGTASLFDTEERIHSSFSLSADFVISTPAALSPGAQMVPVVSNMIRIGRIEHKVQLYKKKTDSLLSVLIVLKGSKLQVGTITFDPFMYVNELLAQKPYKQMTEVVDSIKNVNAKAKSITDIVDGQKLDTTRLTADQKKLIRALVKRYFQDKIEDQSLQDIYESVKSEKGRADLMVSDLIATLNSFLQAGEQNINYQLKMADQFWTTKKLFWFTVTPFIKREGFALFDQSVLTRKDTSSVLYGAGLRLNIVREWRNGFLYFKGGPDFFNANNLADFSKVKYVQQDSLASAS